MTQYKLIKIVAILLLSLGLASCAEQGKSLRVGAKPFAESMILAEMIAQMAESQGIQVERSIPFGTTQKIMEAVKQNVLDVYPEYNGTSLVFLGQAPTSDGDASTKTVQELFKPLGLEYTGKFGFSNDYAMVMTRDRAKELGVSKIEDLADVGSVRYVVDDDFVQRPADGLQQMNRRYGITGSSLTTFPVGTEGKDKIVSALLDGAADVGELFMTDGQIAEYDLVVLEDNLNFFPVYEVAPLARSDALANLPGLGDALKKLAGVITPADMQAMNKAVDLDAQSAATVAAGFLSAKGLLPEGAESADVAKIAVIADPGITRGIDTARALRAIRAGYAGSDLELTNSERPLETLAAGEARVAIVGAESFYTLGDTGPETKNLAEAFAVLGYKTAHLISLRNGANSITVMSKIATGPEGSGSAQVLEMLLSSLGLADKIEVIHSGNPLMVQLLSMSSNAHDGVFVLAESEEREISTLMRNGSYKLVDLNEWAEGGHTARFSFIRPATIPANTYPSQTDAVTSVSTQLVLASPAKTVQTAGEVGPGTAGIDTSAAIPVSTSAVEAIREALGEMEVIDPAIPVHGSLVPEITVVDKSLPFAADISIVNILAILFTAWVVYLVFLPSPRDFKMPEDI
ncbi:MAG: glycine betaine ABC transporter substrate-binding protein [Gammaproteobacteria bacterium]